MITNIDMPSISYCDIPDSITEGHYISEFQPGCYVEHSVSEEVSEDEDSELDNWIISNYPELAGREILINIDY